MVEEELQTQLLRRILYLERSLALKTPGYLKNKSKYDKVIFMLYNMVNNHEISSYIEIDSVYYYLVEKLDEGKENLEEYAREIREFLAG